MTRPAKVIWWSEASRAPPLFDRPLSAHEKLTLSADGLLQADPGCALIVVDIQNDFADPRGALFVPGGDGVAELTAALVESARREKVLVVCTQDWHPRVTPHFKECGGPWPTHCVAGSWGADLHPLIPDWVEVVRKGQGSDDGYSGFGVRSLATGALRPTGLAGLLSKRSIERVLVAGLALDVCVKATALDAIALGLSTTLILDATAPVDLDRGDGELAVAELAAAGVTIV